MEKPRRRPLGPEAETEAQTMETGDVSRSRCPSIKAVEKMILEAKSFQTSSLSPRAHCHTRPQGPQRKDRAKRMEQDNKRHKYRTNERDRPQKRSDGKRLDGHRDLFKKVTKTDISQKGKE